MGFLQILYDVLHRGHGLGDEKSPSPGLPRVKQLSGQTDSFPDPCPVHDLQWLVSPGGGELHSLHGLAHVSPDEMNLYHVYVPRTTYHNRMVRTLQNKHLTTALHASSTTYHNRMVRILHNKHITS